MTRHGILHLICFTRQHAICLLVGAAVVVQIENLNFTAHLFFYRKIEIFSLQTQCLIESQNHKVSLSRSSIRERYVFCCCAGSGGGGGGGGVFLLFWATNEPAPTQQTPTSHNLYPFIANWRIPLCNLGGFTFIELYLLTSRPTNYQLVMLSLPTDLLPFCGRTKPNHHQQLVS